MKLSIIIPCYNEEKTIEQVVNKVLKFNTLEKEIIIVDDCSIDSSREIIKKISENNSVIKYFLQEVQEDNVTHHSLSEKHIIIVIKFC